MRFLTGLAVLTALVLWREPFGYVEKCTKRLASMEAVFSPGMSKFGRGLAARLPSTRSTISYWPPGHVPRVCKKDLAELGDNFSAYDLRVFNVTYADCDTPWVFCNHPKSGMSNERMAVNFGRLPVKMRSYIRHVIGFPRDLPSRGWNGYCKFWSGDIVFMGGNYNRGLSHWVHEVAHSVTMRYEEFPDTADWLTAFNKDSAVPTPYARTNQRENIAEHFVVALYVRTGGVIANETWDKIRWQQQAIVDKYGDLFDQGGTCSSRAVRDIKAAISDDIIHVQPEGFSRVKKIAKDITMLGWTVIKTMFQLLPSH